jgi:hypothetical protein
MTKGLKSIASQTRWRDELFLRIVDRAVLLRCIMQVHRGSTILIIVGMLLFSVLLSSCTGSQDIAVGNYYLLQKNGDVDTKRYINIGDDSTLRFVHVDSRLYVDDLLNNFLTSIEVKDKKTGKTKTYYVKDASESCLRRTNVIS